MRISDWSSDVCSSDLLEPDAVARLLAAYGIPLAPSRVAVDADEAVRIAAPLLEGGGTVAVKLLSSDIVHKSDVDGVRLDLGSAAAESGRASCRERVCQYV